MAANMPYLAAFFGLNEATVQILLTAPTASLVATLFQNATAKAEELDSLRAAKLQLDVELETTVRNSDAKVKIQKNTVTRQAKEIEELRAKLNEAESKHDGLLSQVRELESNASNTTSTSEGLKQRIDSLERTGRETLAAVEIQRIAKDGLAKELEEQHSRAVALQKEVSSLTEQNQQLQNQLSAQASRDHITKQELELCKKNNKWQSDELNRITTESAQVRKDRNALVRRLEREFDELSTKYTSLQQSESGLRQQLTELQTKTDEAFTRNADLQESAAHAAQSFKAQIDSTKRLAELHAQSAATHKARLEDLQTQLDQIRDDAAEEIGRLQTEIETERADKSQAEQTIAELELRLEKQDRPSSVPGTPTGNGGSLTLFGSAQKMVRNLTNTQLYAQCVEAKQNLEHEERRSAKLQAALDELIQEMESRAPELVELKQEQERLEEQMLEYSRMLDEANDARDAAVKEAERWQVEGAANARENDILRQQLRDVSAQVKILLLESQSREQGLEDMSVQERLEIERAARGDIDGQMIEYTNSTQQLISERLVLFRNISELQARNEQLLRLTRELGDKMEGEEARERARQSAADAEEVTQLRAQLERYRDEMQATAAQIDSYMKERDMFRRMLQHRGTIPADADTQAMFGSSMALTTPQRNGFEPSTPHGRDFEGVSKALKEQQKFFDEFRTEAVADRRMLKEQVDALAREKNALQLEVARTQSQLTLASDRYGLLQGNFTSLRSENAELQKRSQALSENAAKQDLRTQQVAEELVEAKSLVESLRAENANTRAEKDLWKRIEARLTEDNKTLMDERSRLSKLNTDLSNLANERERTETEARRRLQARADSLETELAETKRKLDDELESGRKVVLRREFEDTQSRTRVDDLAKSLSYTREELASAKTARDQLQSRVDELKIELRAAEEKAVLLQPRPTARPNGSIDTANSELSTEQQLAIQLSDAKRDLDLARGELESAREQIEQYKTIAQTTEEELASFNQTSEQFREENDAMLSEKDAKIKQLEQRVVDLSSELTDVNSELSDLRTQHDTASQELASQRASLEADVARLTDELSRSTAERQMCLEDVKVQADIARQAQENYETELVKHAEAAQSLQATRQELNALRTEVASIRADAEAAKMRLESAEESWSEQRAGLQRETDELNQRRNDVDAQNKLLHKQLETFSSELQALRQGRAAPPAAEGEEVSESTSNLQEVITFLRREKEIVEVQHELVLQESRRLQQQLAYANGQVDELHFKLAEERKQSNDRALTEASTTKLAATINELNLFRESAVTLRNEARQARERLEEKETELSQLRGELDPIQARLAELEAEAEVQESEVKLITSDRDHWRERTQNIISKYDRVDPAELEELKTRLETLQAEKDQVLAEQEPLKEQITAAEKRLADAEKATSERIEKFKEQAKGKAREQKQAISELNGKLTAALAERDAVSEELSQLKQQAPSSAPTGALSLEETQALQSRLAEADAQANARTIEVEALQTRLGELEAQVQQLTQDLEGAKSSAMKDDHEQGEIVEGDGTERLRQELQTAQQEVARLQALQSTVNVAEGSDVASAIAQLRAEMEQQHQLALSQVQEESEAKIQKARSNLQRQLSESKAKIQEELRAELLVRHSAELAAVRKECDDTIAKLKQEHQAELDRLKKDGEAAIVRENATAPASTDLSEEQVTELMKTNARVRTVMQNSLKKGVAKETERLTQALADKDAEIASLKTPTTATDGADATTLATLKEELEKARSDKDEAVRVAVDQVEKKTKVQLSQRDIAMAKIQFITKVATDTPARPVGEVWEEAKKVKPAPKAAAAAPMPATNGTKDAPTSEQAKKDARSARFGGNAGGTDAPAPNPQATPFVPGKTGGKFNGSGIPTAAAARGGRGGAGAKSDEISIQGAAARGGLQQGGGRGGGQKRQHEGGGGGDGKRARGGGA